MKTVLVTGASGFLGLALTEALARRGDRVIALDLGVGKSLLQLHEAHSNVIPLVGNLMEWPSLANAFKVHGPDAVIHCAAIVGVPASVGIPLNTIRVNIEGTINLLECMRLFGTRRMLQISSEEVYGDFLSDRIDETHPRDPIQAYGISKLACEQLAKTYVALYGMECLNMRTCWVYGPQLPRERVPKNFLTAAVTGRSLHLSRGAEALIDHTYIDDFVSGVIAALDHKHHKFDTYHITSGEAVTLGDIVKIVRDLKPGADISIGPGQYLHDPNVPAVRKGALDISRAKAAFGYTPAFNMRAGLLRSLEIMSRQQLIG